MAEVKLATLQPYVYIYISYKWPHSYARHIACFTKISLSLFDVIMLMFCIHIFLMVYVYKYYLFHT